MGLKLGSALSETPGEAAFEIAGAAFEIAGPSTKAGLEMGFKGSGFRVYGFRGLQASGFSQFLGAWNCGVQLLRTLNPKP